MLGGVPTCRFCLFHFFNFPPSTPYFSTQLSPLYLFPFFPFSALQDSAELRAYKHRAYGVLNWARPAPCAILRHASSETAEEERSVSSSPVNRCGECRKRRETKPIQMEEKSASCMPPCQAPVGPSASEPIERKALESEESVGYLKSKPFHVLAAHTTCSDAVMQ